MRHAEASLRRYCVACRRGAGSPTATATHAGVHYPSGPDRRKATRPQADELKLRSLGMLEKPAYQASPVLLNSIYDSLRSSGMGAKEAMSTAAERANRPAAQTTR
jgi:hypothetical protein